MQLKHEGTKVRVIPTVNELKTLEKARQVLLGVALVPCDQQELAGTTAAALDELRKSLDPAVSE